jgi:hypothetical protein
MLLEHLFDFCDGGAKIETSVEPNNETGDGTNPEQTEKITTSKKTFLTLVVADNNMIE